MSFEFRSKMPPTVRVGERYEANARALRVLLRGVEMKWTDGRFWLASTNMSTKRDGANVTRAPAVWFDHPEANEEAERHWNEALAKFGYWMLKLEVQAGFWIVMTVVPDERVVFSAFEWDPV